MKCRSCQQTVKKVVLQLECSQIAHVAKEMLCEYGEIQQERVAGIFHMQNNGEICNFDLIDDLKEK